MKLWGIIVVIGVCLIAVGCGGASAPPLDLPAPVTGQIDIGTPDAEGKSTITGSEGAVDDGAIVLAINERVETAASESPLLKMLDAVVPTAYAGTTLPAVCDEAGHWCVIANDDGSFEIIIDAVINDSIIIVVIDTWGIEISERLTRTIPSTNENLIQPCANVGVEGKMSDLINVVGIPIALYEGDSDSSNRMTLTDPTSEASNLLSIPLPGCYAEKITLTPYGTSGGRMVMISSEDKLMWVATWNGEHLVYAQTFEFNDKPVDLNYIGEQDYVAVAFETSSGFTVSRISLIDGSVGTSLNIPNPTHPNDAVLTGLAAMKSIGYFADGVFLIGMLTQTDNNAFYINLINAHTMQNLSSGNTYLAPDAYYAFDHLTDMTFAIGPNNNVYMLIANYGEAAVHVRGFQGGGAALTRTAQLGSYPFLDIDTVTNVTKDIENAYDYAPRKIAVNYDGSGKAITFALTGTNNIWKITNFLTSTPATNDFFNVTGAESAKEIATSAETDDLIIGNGQLVNITDEVNGST